MEEELQVGQVEALLVLQESTVDFQEALITTWLAKTMDLVSLCLLLVAEMLELSGQIRRDLLPH